MDAQTLSLPISILNLNQPCTVEMGTPISEVIDLMQEGRFGCVLVVNAQERLTGIITERDLLVHISEVRENPDEVQVDDIMTPSPESLRPTDSMAFALNLMHLGHFRHIPLLVGESDEDEGVYPASVVSSKDIANYVAAFLEEGKEG
ncbi:CBS domain-containing protein [Candidatus Poribacteria bacterium]|nr:CBS domain-containing protein [Candidatus Poribacteria bacterium]